MERKILTLCFFERGDEVLLGLKKRGFGEGLWNGFGGKLEPGETIDDSLIREIAEEVGLTPHATKETAVVTFRFEDGSPTREVHVFRCTDFSGEAVETEEMAPQWFPKTAMPYEQMWPADRLWIPTYLEGKEFEAEYLYDHPSTRERIGKVLDQKIREKDQELLRPHR